MIFEHYANNKPCYIWSEKIDYLKLFELSEVMRCNTWQVKNLKLNWCLETIERSETSLWYVKLDRSDNFKARLVKLVWNMFEVLRYVNKTGLKEVLTFRWKQPVPLQPKLKLRKQRISSWNLWWQIDWHNTWKRRYITC